MGLFSEPRLHFDKIKANCKCTSNPTPMNVRVPLSPEVNAKMLAKQRWKQISDRQYQIRTTNKRISMAKNLENLKAKWCKSFYLDSEMAVEQNVVFGDRWALPWLQHRNFTKTRQPSSDIAWWSNQNFFNTSEHKLINMIADRMKMTNRSKKFLTKYN